VIPEWLQSGITLAVVALAVISLVRHFVKPRASCDRCKPVAGRSGHARTRVAPGRSLPIVP
jgi:hypothetical protein